MKNIILIIVGLVILVVSYVGIVTYFKAEPVAMDTNTPVAPTSDVTIEVPDETDAVVPVDTTKTVIGTSVSGNEITAYHFGTGKKEILFVGGMHGGYSWNTALLGYELVDYLETDAFTVPSDVRVTVIPVLNPDGLKKVVGTTQHFESEDVIADANVLVSGRFNANGVDLNRNFDCKWSATGVWQDKNVSGGSEVFSEPESAALRDYIKTMKPAQVVVWYSAAGGVYSSSCTDGVLAATEAMTNVYAKASGYTPYAVFDSYEVTGDMVNWLAKERIPAISVLLSNHTDTEWTKNKAGVEALITALSE